MPEPARSPRVIRFGLFEADLAAGELRKNGLQVKLQDRPFEILAILLEHPGEVVSREELRRRLWPADTFVDFDHSLNAAVKRLRDALRDSADNPRFIETLARRGYRFMAPVAGALPSNLAVTSVALRGLSGKDLARRATATVALVGACVSIGWHIGHRSVQPVLPR